MPQRLTRLLLVGLLLLGFAGLAAALDLTAQEQRWIRSHGPVRVLLVPTAEPFYVGGRDGRAPNGFAIEMLERVAQRAGLRLQYQTAQNVPEAINMLRGGQADMTPVMRLSRERARLFSVPGSLLPVDPVAVTRREGTKAAVLGDLQGTRVAVLAGSVNDEEFSADYPAATIERFATLGDAFKAVADGRADFAPTTLQEAVYLIESQLLSNLLVRRLPTTNEGLIGPGVLLQHPELHTILAKAMDTITPAERAEVARRWLPVGAATAFAGEPAPLTGSEQAWVAAHGEVRAGYDKSFAPFTVAGPLGGMEGLGADLLRATAHKTGLRIVAHEGAAFADVYQRARTGDGVNVVVGMARTADRSVDFLFVGPFSSVPTAMVMRSNDSRRYSEPDDMAAGTVGLLREHFLLPRLRLRNPGLKLVELDTQAGVLQALAAGEVDAAIGNSAVVSRHLQERYAGRLHITGVVRNGDSDLYFGVPRRHPELARVLDRGLAALTPAELAEINQRWLFVQLQPGLRWQDVLGRMWPLGAVLLAVMLVLWLANRRLRAAKAVAESARAQAEAATAARGRFLAYLAHEVRGLVNSIGWGARMMLDKQPQASADQIAGWIKDSADQTGRLLENTLANERAMNQGIQLQPTAQDLPAWWRETLAPHRLLAAQKGLTLVSTEPQADQPMWFDALRLSQVVNNLVGNAIKFTLQGQVSVAGVWNGATRQLRIEVTDTGPGISPQELALLWEPYAQGAAGRRSAEGAGLGLAITQQIVVAMGGTIAATPGAQSGTCFRVHLPLEIAA